MEREAGDGAATQAAMDAARQAAIQAWDREWDGGLIGRHQGGPLRVRRVASIAALAVIAMVLVWWHGRRGVDAAAHDAPDLSIAPRKAVLPLQASPDGLDGPARDGVAANGGEIGAPAQPDLMVAQRQQMALQQAEQERRLRLARLKSAIVVHGAQTADMSGNGPGAISETDGISRRDEGAHAGGAIFTAARGASDADSQFARSVSGQGVPVAGARQIGGLAYKILQGKLIDAVLMPRAVSDLPGTVCATVQRDVYAERGRRVLIPWGSRVCGVYRAELRPGQARLFAVWNTLRRPDGGEVVLDSIGADQLGTSGMGGQVDTHFAGRFGVAALVSLMGAGAATAGVGTSDPYNAVGYYRQAVQQAAAQTSQQTLQPYLNVPPTVTVAAGERIRILVNRDLDFGPLYPESSGQGGDMASGSTAHADDTLGAASAWLTVVPPPSPP